MTAEQSVQTVGDYELAVKRPSFQTHIKLKQYKQKKKKQTVKFLAVEQNIM